jgi:hypothetical protein
MHITNGKSSETFYSRLVASGEQMDEQGGAEKCLVHHAEERSRGGYVLDSPAAKYLGHVSKKHEYDA